MPSAPTYAASKEIVPLETLLAEPWVREGYRVSDVTGDTFNSYGVAILSRLPVCAVALHELPGHMGRRLVIAELAAGSGGLRERARPRDPGLLAGVPRSARRAQRGHRDPPARGARRRCGVPHPITLDDYVFSAWKPKDPGLAQAIKDHVVADFRGAGTDPAKFQEGLLRLIAALKK